ncbi:MAG: ribosome silencing factor [Planctomycetota bacterium]|nr:MAG: ribosome silencing factor [Planctomycetota bacterium]
MLESRSEQASWERERERQLRAARELACEVARIADDFRAENVVVLDLSRLTPIVDFFVIASGTNPRQLRAIADEVGRVLKERGTVPLGVEDDTTGQWVLHDYGDVVLHLFSPEARELYALEDLWADATAVDWRSDGEFPGAE